VQVSTTNQSAAAREQQKAGQPPELSANGLKGEIYRGAARSAPPEVSRE